MKNQELEASRKKILEQKAQKYLDIAQVIIVALNNKGEVTLINRKGCEILGYPENEIIGKNWFRACLPEKDHKDIIEIFRTLISGEGEHVEYYKNQVIRKDGEERIIAWHNSLLYDDSGKITGVLSSGQDITMQEETVAALERENYLMNTLLEYIPDTLYFKDLESKFIRVSKSTILKHGFQDMSEMVGKSDLDLFSGEHSKQALLDEQKIIKTGKPLLSYEEKETREDGKETWVSTSKMPLFDENGKIVGTFGISKDISVLKQAENELRENEEKYRLLADNSIDAIWQMDLKLCFTYTSPSVKSIFGYTVEEWVGTRLSQHTSRKEFFKIAREALKAIKKYKEFNSLTLEAVMLKKDGTEIPVDITGKILLNKNGLPIGFHGTTRDITERKKAEEALKEREGLLSSITTSAQDGIIMLDNDGNVIFWNGSAEKIFGYKDEEITGKNFHDILVPAEFHEAHRKGFSKFKKTGKGDAVGASLELEALHKNGLKFPVELSLSSMKINDQWHSVGIIRDITERKVAEEKLEEAIIIAENANRAKSEFLANMSHEIRTPMNSILGFAEILEEQLRDNPRNHDYIKGIRNSGKGLLGLINDILDLSKIEAGKLDISYEPINPFTIIEEVRQIFSVKTNKKKLDFAINVDPKLPRGLIFDETRLRQVLFNLIGNAVKFTGEGGITVNVKSEDSNAEGSHVDLVVEIIDTGIGIPENEQQIIFEPFRQKEGQSTRKYGGTGLGLSITQRLVKIMGGTIDVKSTPGRGSAFTVFLPGIQVSALSEINPGQDEEMLNISFQNPLILLIEDIESNRKVIRGYLRSQNINIVEAENGSIGLEKAREQMPDLILMDMQMPVMDGYEATRVIKSDKELKDIPVIALTASTMKRDATEIARLCDGYLRKPVSKSQLLSELKKFLPHSEEKQKIESSADQEGEFFHELKQRLSGDNDIPDEFNRVFNYKIIPEYYTLVKNRSNKRIRNFAELIAEAGRNLNMEMIEAYGNELHTQVDAFNVQRINSMLSEFEELTKVVEEVKP